MHTHLNIGNVLVSLLIMFIILIGTPIQSPADQEPRCPCFNFNMVQGMSNAYDVIDCGDTNPNIHYAECNFYNVDYDDGVFFQGDGYIGQACQFTLKGRDIVVDFDLSPNEALKCFQELMEFVDTL